MFVGAHRGVYRGIWGVLWRSQRGLQRGYSDYRNFCRGYGGGSSVEGSIRALWSTGPLWHCPQQQWEPMGTIGVLRGPWGRGEHCTPMGDQGPMRVLGGLCGAHGHMPYRLHRAQDPIEPSPRSPLSGHGALIGVTGPGAGERGCSLGPL